MVNRRKSRLETGTSRRVQSRFTSVTTVGTHKETESSRFLKYPYRGFIVGHPCIVSLQLGPIGLPEAIHGNGIESIVIDQFELRETHISGVDDADEIVEGGGFFLIERIFGLDPTPGSGVGG